jgi:hypothetical protein
MQHPKLSLLDAHSARQALLWVRLQPDGIDAVDTMAVAMTSG